MIARPKPWRPDYRFRRFDFVHDLKAGQADIPPLRFGPYLSRSGMKRIAEHYGIVFVKIDQRTPKAFRLAVPQPLTPDRLRRLANYIDRTPRLKGLTRLSRAIRRHLAMPDRLLHKRY